MRRVLLVLAAVTTALLLGGAGFVVTRAPALEPAGAGEVLGRQQSAVFSIADRTIRQVRYDDRATLRYSFSIENKAWYDVQVTGLVPEKHEQTLLRLRGLTDAAGHSSFTIAAGATRQVVLSVLMTDCERLSARASSLIGTIGVRVTGLAGVGHDLRVALPEELRTGSAREMFCPRATAKSRPPG